MKSTTINRDVNELVSQDILTAICNYTCQWILHYYMGVFDEVRVRLYSVSLLVTVFFRKINGFLKLINCFLFQELTTTTHRFEL